jgi:hypothetical protein
LSGLIGATPFNTRAAAVAGIGPIANDQYVLVFADENFSGARTLYQKTAGALPTNPAANLSLAADTYGRDTYLIGGGDSIMAGTTPPSTTSPLLWLRDNCAAFSQAAYANFAVSGSVLDSTLYGHAAAAADTIVRYNSHVYPLRRAITGARVANYVINPGANDFPVMTDAQVTTWCATLATLVDTAVSHGFRVFVCTLMRRTGGTSDTVVRYQRLLRINEFIRSLRTVANVVDVAAYMDPLTDPSLFIDGSHPNNAGYAVYGAVLEMALRTAGIPRRAIPPITQKPSVSSASRSILEGAAIVAGTATSTIALLNNVPAIGTGDYTVSFWSYAPVGAPANQIVLSGGSTAFGIIKGTVGGGDYDGLGKPYSQLASVFAQTTDNVAFADSWNHVALSRTGTSLSIYLNGALVETVTDSTSYGALTGMMTQAVGKCARPRVYTRALTAAEVLFDYGTLSEYRASESAYAFCLDDGRNHAGYYMDDLGPNGCHVVLPAPGSHWIGRPGRRGVIRRTLASAIGIPWVPVGGLITKWHVNVTTAGGGALDMSNTNGGVGGDRFYATPITTTGRRSLALAAEYSATAGLLYINGTYTMAHTVYWERA